MQYGMTQKQRELFRFIRRSENEGLPTPSYDEMAAALGLKSKGGIHRLLEGLEERGYIQWKKFRARTVKTIAPPDDALPTPERIHADATALRSEIHGLVMEAKRHAIAIYGKEDDYPLILGVWLWHAMRGTSPGFLRLDDTQ